MSAATIVKDELKAAKVAAQASAEASRRLARLSDEDRQRVVTTLMSLRVVSEVPHPPKDETTMSHIAEVVVEVIKKDSVVTDRIRKIAGYEFPVQRLIVQDLLPDCFSRLESLREREERNKVALVIA